MNKYTNRLIAGVAAAAVCVGALASCGGMKEYDGDLRGRYDYNLKEYLDTGKYKGLSVYVGGEDPTEREIDAKILEYRVLYTATQKSWESVGEGVPAEQGNIVDVRYQGYLDGEKLSDMVNAKEDGYSVTIGADMIIEGVDEQLEGMKIGEKKTFELTVPDPCLEYPYYVGETVTMEVEITDIRAAELEPYDTAMAEYYGCATVEAFEAQIISELKRVRTNQLESYVLYRVMESVMDSFEVKKYPETELEAIRTAVRDSDKAAAEDAEKTLEEYLESDLGIAMEEYDASVDETAKRYVFEEMVLYYIARNEQIALSNAEFDERAAELASENGLTTPAEYVSYMAAYGYSEYEVRERIWFDMVYEFILENTVQKTDK